MKTAILIVSFGTSYKDAREKSLDNIYKDLAKVRKDISVYQAFTSGIIINQLAKQNIKINTIDQAVYEALNHQVECLYVITTHMIPGFEYQKMVNMLGKYKSSFKKLNIASPLLAKEEDCEKLVPVLNGMLHFCSEYEYILMGHGTEDAANIRYQQMNNASAKAGFTNVHIASVEAKPDLEDAIALLQIRKRDKKIILHPFMIVAGDHAKNDMAGKEDSYITKLEDAGFEVQAVVKGLGEYPEFRKIYVNKLVNMIQ